MDKNRMTPAALGALLRGEADNFMTAFTPGGIEAQEAQGQRDLVASEVLPRKCNGCTRSQLEHMGIVFGVDIDALFVHVTLPHGWHKEATEHHMWSTLVDQHGRVRANIFYKAAFYDRDAHITLCRCITVTRRFYDETHETDTAVIADDGRVFFASDRVGDRDYPAIDATESHARTWANEHYPNWRDPLAYWDDAP